MKCIGLLFVLSCVLLSKQAFAFYSGQSADARLLLRGFAVATEHDSAQPDQENDQQAAGGLARMIISARQDDHWAYEFNAYQTFIDQELVRQQSSLTENWSVERSGYLEWSHSDSEYAHLAVDRMNVQWLTGSLTVKLGRQPVNLATTFFFSPNDFFAPFSAQSFYRVYKSGVDGISLDYALGELSTISLIGVLGYKPDVMTDSGWSEEPDSKRASWLARYLLNKAGFEWSVLAGKVRRKRVQALALSGELFSWLGVRAEGQRVEELDYLQETYTNYSISLEHRWESSLQLQIEQFYQGSGSLQVANYDPGMRYPARRYQALGISYEFSPLWTGQATVLYNQIDYSYLSSINLLHSLSDESEISINISMPHGKNHQPSEFAYYPKSLNLEIRSYF